MDVKLDFVPPSLINFISRQLIGNGFRLYQKVVDSLEMCLLFGFQWKVALYFLNLPNETAHSLIKKNKLKENVIVNFCCILRLNHLPLDSLIIILKLLIFFQFWYRSYLCKMQRWIAKIRIKVSSLNKAEYKNHKHINMCSLIITLIEGRIYPVNAAYFICND